MQTIMVALIISLLACSTCIFWYGYTLMQKMKQCVVCYPVAMYVAWAVMTIAMSFIMPWWWTAMMVVLGIATYASDYPNRLAVWQAEQDQREDEGEDEW